MSRPPRLVFFAHFLFLFASADAETFSVRIDTDNYVNEVDTKFVSFTIDPKFLFSSGDKTKGKESICMAASLAPAYLRIAGPSTSHITFHNTSISIDDLESDLPEPNKQKRHLTSRIEEDSLDADESQEDFLSKLKKSTQKLRRQKRHLSQQIEDDTSLEADESQEDLLSKLKKPSQKLNKPKRHLRKQIEEETTLETDKSQEDILSKLKKSTQKLNKQRRHLSKQVEEEEVSLDADENHEDLLSKLKKSSQKLNKPKRHLRKQNEDNTLPDADKIQEDLLSKLKKSSQKLNKQKRHSKLDSQETEKQTLETDSHESILSKLKKPRTGKLLKLKRSKVDSEETTKDRLQRSESEDNLEVSHRQWKKFVKWAKDTGFNLVFAVNNGEKTENGMWDPNPALNMLTVADKENVGDIFWQLGYECNNQTIEDYLNDLQTLRVMVDTFADRKWKVVGGDISGCLQEESKSDFKDYVTLSSDMMDAVLLNGNSSSRELMRMSPAARVSLLKTLGSSLAPLWLTEAPQPLSEAARAADWITSLGYSARNGFNVHFRELLETELYEPTLSFYMALLFKNLVGERVLDISMDNSESNTALFAHCTSLRHKAVPGAVTIYGVNMDSEPARFSVKLTKREEGGDIMQFILGHDHNGNIVVNGRAMFYEGDIRPVVKRVLPYKTLLLNLPPKTFGFWVLANTKVNACYDDDDTVNVTLVEAKPVNNTVEEKLAAKKLDADEQVKKNQTDVDEKEKAKKSNVDSSDEENDRSKRSINLGDFNVDLSEVNAIDNNEALRNRIESINRGLRDVQGLFDGNEKTYLYRVKRQLFDEDSEIRKKLRRHGLKKLKEEHKLFGSGIIEKLMSNINLPKLNLTKNLKELKLKKSSKLNKNKHSKRNSRNFRNKADDSQENETDDILLRRRRSLFTEHRDKHSKDSSENDIDTTEEKEKIHFSKFLRKQEKMKEEIENGDTNEDNNESNGDDENAEIEINTKISNDDAVFKISENADRGLLKNTFENVMSMLEELNNNLSKLWTALSLLE